MTCRCRSEGTARARHGFISPRQLADHWPFECSSSPLSWKAKGRNASRIPCSGPLGVQDVVVALAVQAGSECPLVVRVSFDLGDRLADDRGRLAAAGKEQERRLGITPGEVARAARARPGWSWVPQILHSAMKTLQSATRMKMSVLPIALNASWRRRPRTGRSEKQEQVRIFSSSRWAVIEELRSGAVRALRRTAIACSQCVSGKTGSGWNGPLAVGRRDVPISRRVTRTESHEASGRCRTGKQSPASSCWSAR